jgi:ABC-type glycerol-3-phosphate transport system permease component
MNNKKAQIQIMETIAIMLIFFVLVVIGFLFFLRTSTYKQAETVTKIQELESIRVSQTISFFPELQCSSKNIVQDNCFDRLKLNAFSDNSFNKDTYYQFFYYSNITVTEYYPSKNTWNLYQKVANGTSYKTFVPILIYNPINRTNSFGVLTVQSYEIE